MKCEDCGHWTLARVTRFDDGSEVVRFKAPEGSGLCTELNMNTAPDFGCTKFVPGDHVEIEIKSGEPWQNWRDGPCPGCQGVGSHGTACHRCAGTGNVRYYDDGFIGEEQTRLHPKEKELREKKRADQMSKTLSELAEIDGTVLQPLPPPSAL